MGPGVFMLTTENLMVLLNNEYFLSRIDDNIDALIGNKYYSNLDLRHGHRQVPLGVDAQQKFLFITCSNLWKWKVFPQNSGSARHFVILTKTSDFHCYVQ